MGKYDSLQQHLEKTDPTIQGLSLTFKRIEEILDSKLPNSAYNHRAWWGNPTSPLNHPHAQSWLKAGWKVDSVDQSGKLVHFRRTPRGFSRKNNHEHSSTTHTNTSFKENIDSKSDQNQSQGYLKLLFSLGFEKVGRWYLVENVLQLELIKYKNEKNFLYAFIVEGNVKYIGKSTRTLSQRMNGYKNPSTTQTTNMNKNKRIKELLDQNTDVVIYALVPREEILYKGFPLNIAAGLEDNLLNQIRPPWNDRK